MNGMVESDSGAAWDPVKHREHHQSLGSDTKDARGLL